MHVGILKTHGVFIICHRPSFFLHINLIIMCPVRMSGHMVLAGSWGPTLSNSGLSTFCFLASTPSHASACTDFSLPLALKLLLPEMLIWSSSLSHGELLFTLCFCLFVYFLLFLFTLYMQLKSFFKVCLDSLPGPQASLPSAAK